LQRLCKRRQEELVLAGVRVERVDDRGQAQGGLVRANDVLQVGVAPLETLGEAVEVGDALEVVLAQGLPQLGRLDKRLDDAVPLG